MSHGKQAARDLRYGRRGGRWADSPAGDMLHAIQRARLSAVRADAQLTDADYADVTKRKWPAESLDVWRDIAANDPDHPQHAHACELVAAARPA